jgi:hypothetical protein
MPSDIEQVFHADAQTLECAHGRTPHGEHAARRKSARLIVGSSHVHATTATHRMDF